MNKTIGLIIACLCSISACNYENYDDCEDDDLELEEDFEGGHSRAGKGPSEAGASASGGSGAISGSGSGASGSGASSSEGGSTPTEPVPPDPPATPCDAEQDCEPGFNCDYEAAVCVPADAETCAELTTEEACTNRNDCTPIYAGVNCSCGADCECVGGEPGCICESFEFFVCRVAE